MLAAEAASLDKKRIYEVITNESRTLEERLEILNNFQDIDVNLIPAIKELLMLSKKSDI